MLFISFSSEDESVAVELHRRLVLHGYDDHNLFLDRDPKSGILAGSNWAEVLLQRAQESRAMLVLLSANWLTSQWCLSELVVAKVVGGKWILPLLINSLDSAAWDQHGLGGLQRMPCRLLDPDHTDNDFKGLIDHLKRLGLGPQDYLQPEGEFDPHRHSYLYQSFKSWFARDDMLPRFLHLGTEQEQFVDLLARQLTDRTSSHLRVTGRAGSGKTRLVLEACHRYESLQPQVRYYEDPGFLLNDPYRVELTRPLSHHRCIIVVDDCDWDSYRKVRDSLNTAIDRVVIVTISHLEDSVNDQNTTILLVPPLGHRPNRANPECV